MTAVRIGNIGDIVYEHDATGSKIGYVRSKLSENVSVLDFMTLAQKADAKSGGLTLDLTEPIQKALTYLAGAGGGTLEWFSARITSTLVYQGNNLRIVPRGGNKLVLSGNVRYALQIYPASLDGIVDGTERPAGYSSGIAGQGFETLMYESDDASRLRDIEIHGINYEFTGGSSYGGRFIDAYSVDRLRVVGCNAVSNQNTVSAWYCRDALILDNDLQCGDAYFNLLFYRTYGEAAYNRLRGGYIGSETKGCYPQPGKTIYEAYDSNYEYWHPVKVHHNKFIDSVNAACQMGYFDNATTDISTGDPSGVTLSQWFGQVWGGEMCDNTVSFSTNPQTQSGSYRFNVNSRFCKMSRNLSLGGCILTFGSQDCEISDNIIVNSRVSNTAAIEISGFTSGAVSRNSERLTIYRNRVVGHSRQAIYVKGGDYCDVDENKISGGVSGYTQIQIDSTNSASTSTANHILRNRIIATPVNFANPIKSTGAAGTVIDQNRAYGGWYSGNALDSDGFADAHYKRGVVSADTPYSSVGAAGTCSVGPNYGDQNATTAVPGYAKVMALNGSFSAGWRQPEIVGDYFEWYDASAKKRTKAVSSGKPTSDTDGTVIGTQT